MVDAVKQARIAKVAEMRLLDDDLMRVVFRDNPEAAQLVIRVILGNDALVVTDVQVEDPLSNVRGRSVRLDVSAVDSQGRRYDIEIQRADKGAGAHRARYNNSLMDSDMLPAGADFGKELKDSYVIFITEGDPLGKELPLYHIERVVLETGESFGDGSHIIYANSNIQDDTALGKLMHDFRCMDPGQMYFKPLADKVHDIKSTEKGVEQMCRIMENEFLSGREEGREEGIAAMVSALKELGVTIGKTVETIAEKFQFSKEEAEEKVKLYW